MKPNSLRKLFLSSSVLCAAVLAVLTARAQTLTTIHQFDGTDGAYPYAGLALGTDGSFYGSTMGTGRDEPTGAGTIFKITPGGTLTMLHTAPLPPSGYFTNDGGSEYRSELTQGSDGDFYGVGFSGGTGGYGTVFKITAAGIYTTLYNFDRTEGATPTGALLEGTNGNFYGTTSNGGGSGVAGTVFKITPDGVLTTLHRFDLNQESTGFPSGKLTQARDGNFYGTTVGTGSIYGTVFRLAPSGEFTTLHTFTVSEGAEPFGGVVEGADGNFYGTTTGGGSAASYGSIFKITPAGALTILHSFGNANDGADPVTLIPGRDGKFYGTTYSRGGVLGTIFSITSDGQFMVLYDFTGRSDGAVPSGTLVQADDGSFYGTTQGGGTNRYGTVFHLTVPIHAAFFTGEASLGNGVYYLSFPNGDYFGYYSYLTDPAYIYHFDLGYEYVFDANDGHSGVYLYDFKSNGFFYTSPSFPFPYLYDFTLNTVLYYYPDPSNPGRYNTDGYRFFYRFDNGQIIVK